MNHTYNVLKEEMEMSSRWYPLRYHPVQERLIKSPARFKVVPAGRRSGKTERAKRNLVEQAFLESMEGKYDDYRYFAAAPTRDQAKRIFWDDLKNFIPREWRAEPYDKAVSESELKIRLITGAEIHVIGMDKPQRIEGVSWNGGVLDEYADMKPTAWGANIRPALSDRRGWCWLTGVPEGRNHYYDLYKNAQAKELSGDPEWAVFTWKSADILPEEEIIAAKADLDELTFQQEYEASFVNFEGRVYYCYDENTHLAKLEYQPDKPLIVTFDFNVAPGTATIMQEQLLPSGQQGTAIIGEVHIPRNSTTVSVCNRIIQDWGHHKGKVYCYGDATGGAKGTAKVDGSDWDLIQDVLGRHFSSRLVLCNQKSNPRERARINAMNTRLKNTVGAIKMMIDPSKAPNVVRDLEGVVFLKGGSGEIDKKATPELTHLSDGIGYYVEQKFPIISQQTVTRELF